MSVKTRGYDRLVQNLSLTGNRHTPPAEHYLNAQYLWDSGFHSIVYSFSGDPILAQQELIAVLDGQRPDGFIPNMKKYSRGKRFMNPEDWFQNDSNISSDYSQPAVLALAALRNYEAFVEQGNEREGLIELKTTYDKLAKFYEYWNRERTDPGSSLIGIIHPSECGRDSDPIFDRWKKRFKVNYVDHSKKASMLGYVNALADYASQLMLDAKQHKVEWKVKEAKKNFWVKDVMFNAIYADGLECMAEIAQTLHDKEIQVTNQDILGDLALLGHFETKLAKYQTDVTDYKERAQSVRAEVREKMWDPEDKMFYSLDEKGERIKTASVTSLFPLMFTDITPEQRDRLMEVLEDPKWFNTTYPIPGVPTNSPYYDPHYIEKRIWRGPVWMNMNWYIVVRGLLEQAKFYATSNQELTERFLRDATHIANKSHELVERFGEWEFYDPDSGKGYRVQNFGWSTLGWIMPDEVENSVKTIQQLQIL